METERPLSILPSIKCSDCGAEIQISAMGEHVCTSQQKEDEPSQKPKSPVASPITSPSVEKQPSPLPPMKQSLSRPPSRPNRSPLPRIDPSVANKPYFARQELLSPEGSSGSGHRTPRTPHTGRPGRSPVMRSATSPSPRLPREPSQELTGNMDCAFPPFPTARSKSAARVKSPVPDAYYAPRSPMGTGGANVVRKLDTIAPGPFNAPTRSASRSPSENASARAPPAITIDQPPVERAASPIFRSASPVSYERPVSPPARSASPPQAPASPTLSTVSTASTSPGGTNREGRPIPQRPVRPEPLDGFLAMLKSESEAAGQQLSNMTIRSNTFPLPPSKPKSPEPGSVVRSPSAPPNRQRRPTISAPSQSAPSESLPTISTTAPALPPLPTISSAMAPALPPLPSATDVQKHAHPIVHAPSDSASSASSTRSFKSDISPPVSATSSVSMLSSTLGDLTDPSLVVASLQLKSKQTNRLSPEDAFKPSFVAAEQQQSPVSIDERLDSPTEKMDHFPLNPPRASADFPESPVVPGFLPKRPQSPMSATSTPMASPPTEHGFSSRPTSSKRPGTSSKHICRGCSEPIQGKSVKAADGRLTGRYHKHCFVCKTCKSAFATADFYVIDNNPYCEHHYHELNNSLCAHCDRGIEGPYLETQQAQKFHPSCFTCIDCHKPLSDDYFEIAGKVYCEQHAFASAHRQEGLGPKRNMERRTTRFMVM
ncbi:hypothetical protein E4T48_02067 [Aureobasidium sp. EXF-10727]|nr:hypothetical protein E4T48_02067 [Aureobasidium sp. EXF-10727]